MKRIGHILQNQHDCEEFAGLQSSLVAGHGAVKFKSSGTLFEIALKQQPSYFQRRDTVGWQRGQ